MHQGPSDNFKQAVRIMRLLHILAATILRTSLAAQSGLELPRSATIKSRALMNRVELPFAILRITGIRTSTSARAACSSLACTVLVHAKF